MQKIRYSYPVQIGSFGMRAKDGVLKVLGLPYNGPKKKDFYGTYFGKFTDTWLKTGDRRPVSAYHGMEQELPELLGEAICSEIGKEGYIFDVHLNGSKTARRYLQAAKEGKCMVSTGAIEYLTRIEDDGKVVSWKIAELALLDLRKQEIPASADAKVLDMRAAYRAAGLDMPEWMQKNGKKRRKKMPPKKQEERNGNDLEKIVRAVAAGMAKEEEPSEHQDIVRAEIEDYFEPIMKAAGIMRSKEGDVKLPNFNKITQLGSDEKEQVRSFIHFMKSGDSIAARKAGLNGENFMGSGRTAQLDHEVGEQGAVLVPPTWLNKIYTEPEEDDFVMKYKPDVVRGDTEKVMVPVETTALGKFEIVYGVGSYDDKKDAPKVGMKPVTNYLHKKIVPVGLQLLSTSAVNIEAYVQNAVKRARISTMRHHVLHGDGNNEPVGIFTEAGVGKTTAAADAITAAEVQGWYYSLAQGYRTMKPIMAMNDTTQAYIASLTVAAAPAFQNVVVNNPGEMEKLMGVDVIADGDIDEIAATKVVACFGSLKAGYVLTEGESIAVYRLQDSAYLGAGLVGMLFFLRIGGEPVLAEAFKTLVMHA